MIATKDAATTTTSGIRRCIGSRTFGIEPHEAPLDDFPAQPSRRDGLGLMCREHWTAYTRGLARARRERLGAGVPAHGHTLAASLVGEGEPIEPSKPRRGDAAPRPESARARAARERLAAVDALGGAAHTGAIASDQVQDALAVVSGAGHAGAEAAEEADAA